MCKTTAVFRLPEPRLSYRGGQKIRVRCWRGRNRHVDDRCDYARHRTPKYCATQKSDILVYTSITKFKRERDVGINGDSYINN